MNIINHKKLIVLAWIIIIIASIPAVFNYSHFINYSSSQPLLKNSESANAQNILSSYVPQNQSLTVFVNMSVGNYSKNLTNLFVSSLKNIKAISSVDSPFSVPSYLSDRYIAQNNKSFIITINFNVKSGFQYSNGSSPAEISFTKINNLSSIYFGKKAYVTGNSAIAYQTQQVTSKSGFAFGLIFIVLLIIILITLVSYWSSILGLLFVGFSLILGYVSIFIAGLIIGKISFIVNYTLTAVILGIATDYLVFIIARYREELRLGKSPEEALNISISKAGKAVFISGVIVAFTLLVFSFIPNFRDWGIVLFQAVIYTMLLNITLLPIGIYFLRKRIILKIGLKKLVADYHKDSLFHRTTTFSYERRYIVAGIIIILGAIAGYLFFTLPTTYNFNTGLPQSLSSVKGLNAIESNFGSNLFPVYVLVNSSKNSSSLYSVSSNLLKYPYIKSLNGPLVYNSKLNNFSSPGLFKINGTDYYLYTLVLSVGPYSNKAMTVVNKLRDNKSFLVGGLTSSIIDQMNYNKTAYSELELLIVIMIFSILLVSFKKIRYPIIAISGTFFSVAWSSSILFIISNYILHIQLLYLIPIIIFIILFSIGNDYTVLIISRVKEETAKNKFKEGLSKGIVSSAKTVTSLGIILAFSLGALAFIPVAFLEELGIGFIISLLIDTFIIRTFYFPSMISIFTILKDKIKN
ncbi:MAG: MMPL family transporter [Candidatus Micrarchaeia archaeon]